MLSFSPSTAMVSPMSYIGGKNRLAKKIIAMFPPHVTYCEVFLGGAVTAALTGSSLEAPVDGPVESAVDGEDTK